jgi:hypothetical protein
LEVRVAAAVENLGDDGGDAESMMRSEGHVSSREARRRKQRADKLQNMPNTSEWWRVYNNAGFFDLGFAEV